LWNKFNHKLSGLIRELKDMENYMDMVIRVSKWLTSSLEIFIKMNLLLINF